MQVTCPGIRYLQYNAVKYHSLQMSCINYGKGVRLFVILSHYCHTVTHYCVSKGRTLES